MGGRRNGEGGVASYDSDSESDGADEGVGLSWVQEAKLLAETEAAVLQLRVSLSLSLSLSLTFSLSLSLAGGRPGGPGMRYRVSTGRTGCRPGAVQDVDRADQVWTGCGTGARIDAATWVLRLRMPTLSTGKDSDAEARALWQVGGLAWD